MMVATAMKQHSLLRVGLTLAVVAGLCLPAFAVEHITLRNGFEFDCLRREVTGDRIRLYLLPSARVGVASQNDGSNYIEVPTNSVLWIETIPDPPATATIAAAATDDAARRADAQLTPAEMAQMLVRAGTLHNIDADLLASVVQAESGGNAHAVSRVGARGLMQLMPGTASELGVHNAFAPEENIGGGTTYLDGLLTRYHDDIMLAVAAYNAGPAAVDRYHGIPPYAETRAYVARVIREFNRRKRAAQAVRTSLTANTK
jgi:soluble lytic murein transglycosylase-like protein